MPAAPAGAERRAWALWFGLAILVAARALASWSSGMWLWGLDAQRFLPFVSGWLPWGVLALALVPAFGRALAPAATALGGALVRRPALAALIAVLLGVGLVAALPDQALFLGDFALRTGTIATGKDLPGGAPAFAARLFPQAMPLDVLVHVRLPGFLIAHAGLSVPAALRLLGALGAALLAVAAVRLPRALALDGAAALAAAAILWSGGYLGMFTGYGKSAIEMTALTALAGAAAFDAARNGRGLVTHGLATRIALGFHRSGVLLLPLALAGFAAAPGPWTRPTRWIGAAIVAASLAMFGPRAVQLLTTFDVQHHLAPPGPWTPGGLVAALFAPLHLLDVLNVTLVLSPLAPLLLVLWPGMPGGRRTSVLIALALPALAMLLLTRPQQGVFRDRDVFAQAGVSISMLVAWAAGETLRADRRRAWLAASLVFGAVVPSAQWLVLMHRSDDALRYVRAYIDGPPARPAWDRAATWDFIGTRALAHERWETAGEAYERAVQAARNPRLIAEWGMTDVVRGRYARAESLFRSAVTLNPDFTMAWNGLAAAASWNNDTAACAESERNLARLDPQNPRLPELRRFLARARAGK